MSKKKHSFETCLLNSIIEDSSDVILIISTDNKVVEFNKSALDFFNQNKEAVQNKDYVYLCDYLELPVPFKKFLGSQEQIEFQNYVWSNTNVKTQNNELHHIILGKKNTENSLQHENVLLKSIIASIPGSIYWKDTNGTYLGCNDFMLQNAGFSSKNDIIGKTDQELWPNQARTFTKTDHEVMSLKCAQSVEERVDLPNGKTRFFTVEKTPLFDDKKNVIGILGNSLEITELKNTQTELIKAKETAEETLNSLKKSQMEEQKQRKEAERLEVENTKHKADLKIAQITVEKEQEMRKTVMMLVGDIVHDLRTPMATIDNATHILSSISPGLNELVKEANELKSKALESMNGTKLDYVINKMPTAQKEAINFMGQFINTTLHELSVAQKHPDEGVKPEELTKCSIRRVLENTMEGYPRRENLIINQYFSYDFIFMGNSILMLKILFNLIKNADEQILANGKGEITITTKEAGDKNLLIIKDTAGGASPEIVENMSAEFFTTKKDGTGIGLAFCKKMMRNFGGDLTCHSVFGEYIEFTLSFPKTADTQPFNVKS